MSTTFIQPGLVLTLTAPTGGVTSGVPLLIGALLVIPRETVAQGLLFDGDLGGVHALTKVGSQAWTEGQKIYWDAGNSRCTNVVAGQFIGVAVAAVGSGAGETTGLVRLNGIADRAVQAAEADLVEAFGTSDGTLADVTATFSQTILNNNFQDLATKVNAILAKLRAAGIVLP